MSAISFRRGAGNEPEIADEKRRKGGESSSGDTGLDTVTDFVLEAGPLQTAKDRAGARRLGASLADGVTDIILQPRRQRCFSTAIGLSRSPLCNRRDLSKLENSLG